MARDAESVAREAESVAREAESVARLAEVDARTTRLMISEILRLTRELRDHDLPSNVRYILESELKQQKLKWQKNTAISHLCSMGNEISSNGCASSLS